MVLGISAMNTQWHHFLEILDQRQSYLPSYLVLQPSLILTFPLSSSHLECGPSCFSWCQYWRTIFFHTIWGPVFSDNCAVSSEGGHLFALADVSVSWPVKMSELAPIIGLASEGVLLILRLRYHQSRISFWGYGFTGSLGTPRHPDCMDIICLLFLSAVTSFLTGPVWWKSCKAETVDIIAQLFTVFQIMQRMK